MTPADPTAPREALATVREGFAKYYHDPGEAELDKFERGCELLAREFVRLLDAGELVRVRPLAWVWRGHSGGFWAAQGAFGPYTVDDDGWCFDGGYENYHGQTVEQSKVECDAHYRARLAAALEPIIATEARP